jgi:hypothetical protein
MKSYRKELSFEIPKRRAFTKVTTRMADSSLTVRMNRFQHLFRIDFSAFGRHTFHPCPLEGVFNRDFNNKGNL